MKNQKYHSKTGSAGHPLAHWFNADTYFHTRICILSLIHICLWLLYNFIWKCFWQSLIILNFYLFIYWWLSGLYIFYVLTFYPMHYLETVSAFCASVDCFFYAAVYCCICESVDCCLFCVEASTFMQLHYFCFFFAFVLKLYQKILAKLSIKEEQ